MLKQIQKTFLKILEKELTVVLAVLMIAVFTFWVSAAGDSITFNLSVIPAGGTITVTYPNGGETWTVNDTETVTWTTQGTVDSVKIELQRESGGTWEELIDSTINDGSFPWPVTVPTTTEALIKITEVGDETVADTSDAVFTIIASGGGGGNVIYNPAIDTVVPRVFINTTDVNVTIGGFYFEWGAKVWLDDNYFQPTYVWPTEMLITVPAQFPVGEYTLCIQNLSGGQGCYHLPVIVYAEEEPEEPEEPPEEPGELEEEPEDFEEPEEIMPPSTGGEASFWPDSIFGSIFDYFKPPKEPLDYEPVPKLEPSETKQFTDATEQCPFILLIWILILISLIKTLTRKIPSIWLYWLVFLMGYTVFLNNNCSISWSLWLLTGITFVLFAKDYFLDRDKVKPEIKH